MSRYDKDQKGSQIVLTNFATIDGRSGELAYDNPGLELDEAGARHQESYSCSGCSKKSADMLTFPEDKLFNNNNTSNSSIAGKTDWRSMIKDRARRSCTKKILYKRIPILEWLPKYDKNKAIADLVAGVTVGLTVIPQAIAYSNVAGLPPEYGLYSAFMACFVYTILGSIAVSPIGPTAIAAILTRQSLIGLEPQFAVLLCFLSGCVELLMGIFQLGFLIDFISGPVSIGFTSAAAIIIANSQIKDLLGLEITGSTFLGSLSELFGKLEQTSPIDCGLGFTCIIVILVLRKIKEVPYFNVSAKQAKNKTQLIISKVIWFISTSRNIIVVVTCGIVAYVYENKDMHPFKLTGHVKPGLPDFGPPPFSTTSGNTTYNFVQMVSALGSGTLIVPLLGILENVALAKVFSDGKAIDATQEMIAIGACNIVSSFAGSMPVTGALARGAVNHASGVATTFGGIYTGTLVIISLQFFTPYFFYIPKASLAAVIIAAVIFMVELHVIKPIWRSKKVDVILVLATFLSCLFIRLELGIVIGIGINLLFLLYASARPSVHVEKINTSASRECLLITPDRSLVFPSVEYVRKAVSKAGERQGASSIPVVIDARHIQGADFTAAKGIKLLIEDFHRRNQPILFINLKPSVVNIFTGVKPQQFRHCQTYEELNRAISELTPKQRADEEYRY